MQVPIGMVILLDFVVNILLLLGAERMCGYPTNWGRTALAAAVAGVHGGACLLPGFAFLGNALWCFVFLGLTAWIAFGFSVSGVRRGLLFALLHLALGGITIGLDKGGFWILPIAAAGMFILCSSRVFGGVTDKTYIPVELRYQDKHLHLTALADTGNTLRDPITGSPVLIVGSEVACQLLGLTRQQLQRPAESISDAGIPGLRLIPYRSVGQPCGMLLALRLKEVKIGKWQGSSLVAFAPDPLGKEGVFQALTGGTV